VCDLETSKEEAKSPLKGCEYKPTMGCDAERNNQCKSQSYVECSFLQLPVTLSILDPYILIKSYDS